jgi:multidrug efflux system membrane fusion protein
MDSPPAEKPHTLTKTGRALVAVLILAVGGGLSAAAVKLGRHAEEAPAKRPVPDVELVVAQGGDVELTLESQGIVQAVTETRAAAEVPGRVLRVSPAWDAGGSFKANEELLALDDADYKAALANAEALAAEAALAVKMEEQRGKQAVRDWEKLATGKPDTDLVTRVPQLKAAQARSTAAQAAVEKARRDLDRTVIHAPYAGRIRATLTDIGSYAAPGAPLAEFFATDAYQISLPLSIEDFNFLNVTPGTPLKLTAQSGDRELVIPASILRTGAEIDRTARTINVVAEIKPGDHPSPLLVPGLFVKAFLPGITLKNTVKLPRVCLLPGDRVAVVNHENKLSTRAVKVVRTTRDAIFISEGVKPGERVLATVLAVITEGLEVKPVSDTPGPAPVTGPGNPPPVSDKPAGAPK